MKTFAFVLAGALFATVAKPARAQTAGTAAPPAPAPARTLPNTDQLIADLVKAETQSNGGLLVFSYGQAIRDNSLAGAALAHLMGDYYHMRSQSQTATQASQAVNEAMLRFALLSAAQNQLNVQQNQRILEQNDQIIKQNAKMIELLEQIAKK